VSWARDQVKGGYIIEQDHDPQIAQFPHLRRGDKAFRLLRLDEFGKPVGEKLGDYLSGVYWPADPDARKTGKWGKAWPVIVTRGKTIATGGSPCGVLGGGAILPQFRSGDSDPRFVPFTLPSGAQTRYPVGTFGLILPGTNETAQEEVFLATDARLVAPNRYGASALGTPVHDVDSSGGYGVMARLQSFWNPVQPRGGKPQYSGNVLAWHLGPTGCNKTNDGWGMVYGLPGAPLPGEPLAKKNDRLVAVSAEAHGGPLDLGSMSDKHQITDTEDGEPVNSLHLPTTVLFRGTGRGNAALGNGGDAPAEFRRETYVPASRGPVPLVVELRYDPSDSHSWFGGTKPGLWRWQAWGFHHIPSHTGCPYPQLPDLRDGPGVSVTGEPVNMTAPHVSGDIGQYEPSMGVEPIAIATMTEGGTGMVAFPQRVTTEGRDYRRAEGLTVEQLSDFDHDTPASGRLEAFGDEGGLTIALYPFPDSTGGGGG